MVNLENFQVGGFIKCQGPFFWKVGPNKIIFLETWRMSRSDGHLLTGWFGTESQKALVGERPFCLRGISKAAMY